MMDILDGFQTLVSTRRTFSTVETPNLTIITWKWSAPLFLFHFGFFDVRSKNCFPQSHCNRCFLINKRLLIENKLIIINFIKQPTNGYKKIIDNAARTIILC
jgi:hypothetical protein